MDELNDRELATVLAALRLMQSELGGGGVDRVLAMPHFDDVECLTMAQIDELCCRLNK